MKKYKALGEHGFTLTELLITNIVFAIVALSFLALYSALVTSASLAKRKAVALTLATNQMEYLKSLPFDNLAVSGGSIYSTNPLPATTTKTINNFGYTITTSVSYADDSYDGCASYPTTALKQKYCRNYPPPSGAPTTDTNPQDYKDINIRVTSNGNINLAEVDTQVAARVSETNSTTGALFVTVLDDSGNPIPGAAVSVVNTTISPNVNLGDETDGNGVALFYGIPPDTTNYDFVITASKTDYSTLKTIAPSGSLQPNYQNAQIFTQQSSLVTLKLKPMGQKSLVIETTDTSNTPLGNAKIYIKGGYKKYNATTDTSYYFDNMTPSDTRPTTDSGGMATVDGLVPGSYIFCGDVGATNCKIGNTTYYLAAAVPYGGANAFNPIVVPTYITGSTQPTFEYNTIQYLQKVRLMLTTDSTFPRVATLTPDDVSLAAGGLNNFSFQINGNNLPCNAVASSCATTVKFIQGANNYPASCTGLAAGLLLTCTVNLSSISIGQTQLQIIVGSKTLTIPANGMLGGLNVST